MEPAPLNRLLALSQMHLEHFQQAQSEKAPLSKLDTLVNQLSKDLQALREVEEGQSVDEGMLDKISNTLQSMRAEKAPEQHGNAANILQSLQEKVEEIRKRREEVRYKKRDHKITRLEVVEFLNSTEKEFTRTLKLIREKDADEEQLQAFIEALKKQIEEMKLNRAMNLKNRKLQKGKQSDTILALIEELLQSEMLISIEQRDLFVKTVKLFKKELLSYII